MSLEEIMKWIEVIKRGKATIVSQLNEYRIDYSHIKQGKGSYFKLCSLVFQYEKSNIENTAIAVVENTEAIAVNKEEDIKDALYYEMKYENTVAERMQRAINKLTPLSRKHADGSNILEVEIRRKVKTEIENEILNNHILANIENQLKSANKQLEMHTVNV